jgi:predicted DNA-binding protein YlxM (UPF0122 family)
MIKRSEALLADYEQKLGLVARRRRQHSLFEQAERELATLGISRQRAETGAFWQVWKQLID